MGDMTVQQEIDISNETVEVTEKSMKHYDDRNEVELTGTLVGRKDGEKFTLLSVLTTAGRNRDITSLISVKVPTGIELPDFKTKARISVKGKLRCRPVYRNGREEKPSYEAYVEASSVTAAMSAMEAAFGIKGRSFGESFNSVILTGTVARMTQINKNTARLTLAVHEKGQKERLVEAVFYARNNMKQILPKIAAGNKICAIAEIQNYKKDPAKMYTINGKTVVRKEALTEEGGKPSFVKNIVILDVNEI